MLVTFLKIKKMSNQQLAYFLARITLGINLLLHGVVRIPKLTAFSQAIAAGFQESVIAPEIARLFAYTIPFIELILGILIILGLKTRKSLVAAAIFIIVLISGTCLKGDWATVSTQMLYALFIFFLIFYLDYNRWAIDTKNKSKVDGFKTKK